MVAETNASSGSDGRASVWENLREAADLAGYRPRLREGLAWKQFTSTQGEEYVIVQNPDAATYLRLLAADFYVFQLMDGSHSIQELVVAYMLRFHQFALQHIIQLVDDLRYNQFLTDPPYYTYREVRRLSRRRSLSALFETAFQFYLNREFPISGIDRGLERIYRAGIWTLFTLPGTILLAVMTLVGVPLLLRNLYTAHISLTAGASLGRYVPIFYVSFLAMAIVHELGHAFAVKACGRTVRRSGLCIFYGFPGLFVDTQDIWMERRGARIAASWAGPYSGFILAGLAGLALATLPHGGWVPLVRAFGIVALVENAFQLQPFIQLDGYYILMDWLDIPNLRRRALIFIRHDLWRKIWRRERFNREERIFAIFGVLAILYTAYAIGMAVTFWWAHARDAIRSALRVPNLGSLLVVVFIALILLPFVIGVGGRLLALIRGLLRAAGRATGVARDRWYRERVILLSQVPALARLGYEPIQSLAHRLREERAPAGAAIVRQGEPGDRFYLIVDGRAEVVIADSTGSRAVGDLGPMDYFGERALIENAPRAATVRAKTKLRLLSLGARDFRTSITQYIAADASLHARLDELEELHRFPLLESLGAREKEILLGRLRPIAYRAGQTIVRQGEPGDEFYLLRSGSVEVTRRDETGAETRLETLGPGNFFGEIALLLNAPRIASVRSLEEIRVWALTRQDFTDLLSQYFNLDSHLAPVVSERLADDRLLLVPNSDRSRAPVAGDPAPDFALESSDEKRIALADYRGRTVLVWFSTAAASDEFPAYVAELRGDLPPGEQRQIAALQIVPETSDGAPGELPAPAPTFPVLVDPDGSTYRAYGMYTRLASPTAAPGVEWQDRMDQLLRATDAEPALATIREGAVLIGPDGSIQQITRTGARLAEPEPAGEAGS